MATLKFLYTPAFTPRAVKGMTSYVRDMVGDDANYVGQGLYREEILIENSATAGNRVTFVADTTDQRTGDPAGVDANIFALHSTPGVYLARLSYPAAGGG